MTNSSFTTLSGTYLNIQIPDLDGADAEQAANLYAEANNAIASGGLTQIGFHIAPDVQWGSLSLAAIKKIATEAERHDIALDYSNIPTGAARLLALAKSAAPQDTSPAPKQRFAFVTTVGEKTIEGLSELRAFFTFTGTVGSALGRLLRRKAYFEKSDLKTFVQAAGPDAIVIVGVVNLLLGVILAFMGAVQLQLFGAEIFVANLVALGHTREIAPMMTAIVLAGRTGAAYAAQLGTMQVNEEIDALTTFGISPIEFLVLPRMIALALMTPLLVLYGDAIGMFGGYVIGTTMLDLGTLEYISQTQNAITISDVLLGVFKGTVFGMLVAITGCRYGMESGRSASAVGDAATRAVVSGILAIIVTTAIFAVLTNWIGI